MVTQQVYDAEALRRRIPEDRSELYLGFSPWEEDLAGWTPALRERFDTTSERPILRTVWDDPKDSEARVLVEVATRISAEDAVDALVDLLSWNQLASLPEGPANLGHVSFVYPEDSPTTLYFVRGNVCITVVSYGRVPVPVLPMAKNIDNRLAEFPSVERNTIVMESKVAKASVGEPVVVDFKLPWRLGDDGFVKISTTAGRLRVEKGQMVFRGTKRGSTQIEVLALEPGREPYRGHMDIEVE